MVGQTNIDFVMALFQKNIHLSMAMLRVTWILVLLAYFQIMIT